MNTEKLELLMQIKKKSDASKTQKNEFVDLIIELLKENGYSNEVEKYLFLGYSFAGAKPLVEFMRKMSAEDRLGFVETVVSGKLYALNEKGISFKLLVDLLASVIVTFPKEQHIVAKVIKLIPGKSKIKNGQLLGDAPKIIDKYFVSAIKENTVLPALIEMELSKDDLRKFTDIFVFVVSSIKPGKNSSERKIKHVLNWLTVSDNKQSEHSGNEVSSAQIMTAKTTNDNGTKPLKTEDIKNLCERLLMSVEHYEGLEKGTASLNKKISALEKDVEVKKAQIETLENRIKEIEKELAEQISRNNLLEKELNETKTEAVKLQGVIDVYSEDKQSSQTEQLNAIASKLKAEYRDFKDALEMEMTVELGENIKDQVIQIFKILAKAGIDVESR